MKKAFLGLMLIAAWLALSPRVRNVIHLRRRLQLQLQLHERSGQNYRLHHHVVRFMHSDCDQCFVVVIYSKRWHERELNRSERRN